MKNLFLRQSYLDAWEDYERSIRKSSFSRWDYIILTSSNEEQAKSFRQQIAYRLERGVIPGKTKYLVLADTSISDLTPLENHENLIFLELFLTRVKDYSPLTTCRALEDLNLCYTNGDPAPIAEMTWLKRLWWSGCWLARETLRDELTDTYTEF